METEFEGLTVRQSIDENGEVIILEIKEWFTDSTLNYIRLHEDFRTLYLPHIQYFHNIFYWQCKLRFYTMISQIDEEFINKEKMESLY